MAAVTTRAIVLRGHDYGDSSRIVRFYTEAFGLLSVVAHGVRGRAGKGSGGASSFATGELTAYVRPQRDLHTMKDFSPITSRDALARDTLRFAGASVATEIVLSHAEQERHERQARRQVRIRQSMLATLAVLLGLALTAGGLAYQQRESALDQERVARSQALAVRSASLAGGRPEASMLLAGEAYRAHTTAEARGALLSTQSQPFSDRLGGHRGPVNAVVFAPDDRFLATASSDGTVTLRRVSDRRTTATFTVSGPVRSIAFSPDGRTLAATSARGPVSLWDIAERRRKAVLPDSTKVARKSTL